MPSLDEGAKNAHEANPGTAATAAPPAAEPRSRRVERTFSRDMDPDWLQNLEGIFRKISVKVLHTLS